jgi:hypothetical protein
LIAKLLKLGFAGLASLVIGFALSQHYNAFYRAKPIRSEFELTRKTIPLGKLSTELMRKSLVPSVGSVEDIPSAGSVEDIQCRKKLTARGIIHESGPCFDLDKALASIAFN